MESGEGDGGLEQSIVLWEALEAPDRCGESKTMPKRPECLSKDWAMKVCIRNSSKTVGVRDQYYYDLKSHHHFRSKKEVEYFLPTRMIQRYMPKSKKSTTNKPGCGLRVRKDCQSLSGNHGWPQRKTSTVACMNFNGDVEILNTQILKYRKGVIHRRNFLAHSKVLKKYKRAIQMTPKANEQEYSSSGPK